MDNKKVKSICDDLEMVVCRAKELGLEKIPAFNNLSVENVEAIIKAMRKQIQKKSMDEANNWIPCSERLPEKPLVQYDSYIVQEETVITPYTAYWDGETWTDTDEDAIKGVIAWMPLPEPYIR